MNRLKPLFHVTVGFFAALGVLSASQGRVAHALPGATSPSTLVTDVNTLKAQVAQLQAQVTLLKGTPVPGPQGLPGPQGVPGPQGPAGTGGGGLTPQQSAILGKFTLEDGTGAASATGNELHLVGVNLHLEDGSGSTYDNTIDNQGQTIPGKPLLGLGNLIIGYNETQSFLASSDPLYTSTGSDVRTGSHNLVVGSGLNFASFGGVVFGIGNGVSGPFATVTGGDGNIATGQLSSVSGGNQNTASGMESSVSGGYLNTASFDLSTIGGGYENVTTRDEEWLAGRSAKYFFGNIPHP